MDTALKGSLVGKLENIGVEVSSRVGTIDGEIVELVECDGCDVGDVDFCAAG